MRNLDIRINYRSLSPFAGVDRPENRNCRFENNLILGVNDINQGPLAYVVGDSHNNAADYNFYYGIKNQENLIKEPNSIYGINPLLQKDLKLDPASPARSKAHPVTFTGHNNQVFEIDKDYAGISRTIPWDMGIYAD